MAEIFDFERVWVRRQIGKFAAGELPDYLAKKHFKKDFKSIDEVLGHWHELFDDDLLPVLTSIRTAYMAFTKDEIKKETQSSAHLKSHWARILKQKHTMSKEFWNPAVHAGYPKDQNPVKIFCYEYSHAFKRFTDQPYAVTEETKFTLQFGRSMASKILDALEMDIGNLDIFLKQWAHDPNEKTMADLPEVREAKFEKEELTVCMGTILTILNKNT